MRSRRRMQQLPSPIQGRRARTRERRTRMQDLPLQMQELRTQVQEFPAQMQELFRLEASRSKWKRVPGRRGSRCDQRREIGERAGEGGRIEISLLLERPPLAFCHHDPIPAVHETTRTTARACRHEAGRCTGCPRIRDPAIAALGARPKARRIAIPAAARSRASLHYPAVTILSMLLRTSVLLIASDE